MYGSRPFALEDESRNNAAVALVTLGEGWHHNHHAFPTSARHGLRRLQFDPSYAFIRALEAARARAQRAPAERRAARAEACRRALTRRRWRHGPSQARGSPAVRVPSATKEMQRIGSLADEVDISEGKTLLHQGDFAHEFMVVLEGRAEVVRDSEPVAELGPGDFLGEVAALEQGTAQRDRRGSVSDAGRRHDRPRHAPHRQGDAGRGHAAAASRARALPASRTDDTLDPPYASGMEEDRGLRVGAPAKVAAGPRSVVKSLRVALGRMGPVRSVRTLARVNQKDGFDCPGVRLAGVGSPPHRRVLRERRQSRRRGGDEGARDARVLRALRHRAARGAVRLLARTARAADGADGEALRLEPVRADLLGRRVRPDRRRARAARLARRGDLLHVRAHEQRGGVLLPALRPGARDEQPARLLEPLPRVERRPRSPRRSAWARAASRSRTSTPPT